MRQTYFQHLRLLLDVHHPSEDAENKSCQAADNTNEENTTDVLHVKFVDAAGFVVGCLENGKFSLSLELLIREKLSWLIVVSRGKATDRKALGSTQLTFLLK